MVYAPRCEQPRTTTSCPFCGSTLMPLFSSVTPGRWWSVTQVPDKHYHCSGVYWAFGLLGEWANNALSMIAKT